MESIIETQFEKESRHLCEKWIVVESCRRCLFENLCGFEERQKLLNNND